MPYRRGQGSSARAGPYIGDEISSAFAHGGIAESERTMTRLLSGEHFQDQLGALQWLKAQPYVLAGQVAVAGNSFGGVESVPPTKTRAFGEPGPSDVSVPTVAPLTRAALTSAGVADG